MTRDDVSRRVQAIVCEVAGPERTPREVGLDTPLGENGFWLDSVDFLELLVACQEAFGAEFRADTDLSRQNLSTVGSLAAMIRAKLEG
jgi:acyl carrier protein